MNTKQAVVTSSPDWKKTGQKVAPLAGREVREYHCPACARRFVWHVHPNMPAHIDPYSGTWCDLNAEAA
jgi:protein-disulfide isomerase